VLEGKRGPTGDGFFLSTADKKGEVQNNPKRGRKGRASGDLAKEGVLGLLEKKGTGKFGKGIRGKENAR